MVLFYAPFPLVWASVFNTQGWVNALSFLCLPENQMRGRMHISSKVAVGHFFLLLFVLLSLPVFHPFSNATSFGFVPFIQTGHLLGPKAHPRRFISLFFFMHERRRKKKQIWVSTHMNQILFQIWVISGPFCNDIKPPFFCNIHSFNNLFRVPTFLIVCRTLDHYALFIYVCVCVWCECMVFYNKINQ